MKAVLFLCLLAFMACQKDIIDIGKCIYKAPKVQELIGDVIAAIVNQDFSKLLPKLNKINKLKRQKIIKKTSYVSVRKCIKIKKNYKVMK